MIDKEAIRDELRKMFIGYQYRLENPISSPGETESSILMHYHTNPLFNRKVNRLVMNVMYVLNRHIDDADDKPTSEK